MSDAYLGASFDIHAGGVDLTFRTMRTRLRQSEAATGQPFVNTWLHCAHLQMGGSKMAKSSGNIARVRDLLEAGHSPRAVRYSLISVHYRVGLNHSDESLSAAAAAVERLDALVGALSAYRQDRADDADLPAALAAAREAFGAALDDDLGISPALAVLFDLVRDLNRRIDGRSLSTRDAERALGLLRDLDQVLAVALGGQALDPDAVLEAGAQRAVRDWAARIDPRRSRSVASRSRTPAMGSVGGGCRNGSRLIARDATGTTNGRPTGLAGTERRAPAAAVVRAVVRPATRNALARTMARAVTPPAEGRRAMPALASAGDQATGPTGRTDRRATATRRPDQPYRGDRGGRPHHDQATVPRGKVGRRDKVVPRARVVRLGPAVRRARPSACARLSRAA